MTAPSQEQPIVLLACNQSDSCSWVGEILNSSDLQVHSIPDEVNTVEFARQVGADVVIGRIEKFRSWSEWSAEVLRDENGLLLPPFLLLAEGLSAEEVARCLDDGVDDFVSPSEPAEILRAKVRSLLLKRGLRQDLWNKGKALRETNALLERNFKELTTILLKMLEVRIPGTNDRADIAKGIADFVTERLGLRSERRKQIIFAALLHEVGKVGLPDDIVGKHYHPLQMAVLPIFHQHVTVGSMVISTVTGYKEAAEAVYHQLENVDGSGFPDELVGEEIPIGARILRAVVFHEELRALGTPVDAIIERIRSAMNLVLDQRVANLLIEFLASTERQGQTDEIKVAIDDLVPGMVVAEDVFAASGVKLLPKGVELQEKTLALLRERNEIDPIIGGVYVVSRP